MHDLTGNHREERPCDGSSFDVDILTQPVLPCRKAFPGDGARVRGKDGKNLFRSQGLSHGQGCVIGVSQRSVHGEFQHRIGTHAGKAASFWIWISAAFLSVISVSVPETP